MTTTDTDRSQALAERLFAATRGALALCSVYLGSELGVYATLAQHGRLTHDELAERAGIAPRYAREWLEQQAVAGLLDVERADAERRARRYGLDTAHARVLTDADDPSHVAPFAHMIAGIGAVLPRVADAYRTGGGVPYEAYGRAFRHGQGHINRPAFTRELPTDWLAAAARVGPPSRSPTPSSTRTSTASTPTPPRSPTRPATPPTPAATPACGSSRPTPPSSPSTAPTTSSSCSKRCTT